MVSTGIHPSKPLRGQSPLLPQVLHSPVHSRKSRTLLCSWDSLCNHPFPSITCGLKCLVHVYWLESNNRSRSIEEMKIAFTYKIRQMFWQIPDVRGPVATIVIPSFGSSRTSSFITSIFSFCFISSVTIWENFVLSTARAPPAGTWAASAHFIIMEFKSLISSFKSPTAFPAGLNARNCCKQALRKFPYDVPVKIFSVSFQKLNFYSSFGNLPCRLTAGKSGAYHIYIIDHIIHLPFFLSRFT